MHRIGFAALGLASLFFVHPTSAAADDSYILALSWQPAFCAAHSDRVECKAPPVQSPLVLHGLWPDWDVNGDGKRNDSDAYCLDAGPARDSVIAADKGDAGWKDLPEMTLTKAMKDDLPAIMPGAESHLDRHEWWKHGTCSGLKPIDYFGAAILLTRQAQLGAFGKFIAARAGSAVRLKDLIAVFDQEFGAGSSRALKVSCARGADGASSLAEIQLRLKRDRIAEGLQPTTLDTSRKPAKGKCGSTVFIQGEGP
jgi:ribonuclease T2